VMMMLKVLLLIFVLDEIFATYLEGAPSGDFDNWVFALEWEPEWIVEDCTTNPNGLLVQHFTNASYGATHLSVHGLWPNYNASLRGYEWPQFCVYDGINYSTCDPNSSQSYCNPSQLTLDEFNVSARWKTYAVEYSWNGLVPHEWSKHGSCSGYNQTYYFSVIEQMFYRMSGGVGFAFVTAHVGQQVLYTDLDNAFLQDTQGHTLAFVCNSCQLSEVWTAWDADPVTLLPTTPIDTSDSDSCASCKYVTILGYNGCGGGLQYCLADALGPECVYDTNAGTSSDPCLQYQGCLRCAKNEHSGEHYCTSQSEASLDEDLPLFY